MWRSVDRYRWHTSEGQKMNENKRYKITTSQFKIPAFFWGKHFLFWCFKLQICFGVFLHISSFLWQQLLLCHKWLKSQIRWTTEDFPQTSVKTKHKKNPTFTLSLEKNYTIKTPKKPNTQNAVSTLFDPKLIYARVTETLSWRLLQSSGLCSLL